MKVKIVSFWICCKRNEWKKNCDWVWQWMCVCGLIHFPFSFEWNTQSESEQLRKILSKPLGSSIQSVVSVDRDYYSDSMEGFIWEWLGSKVAEIRSNLWLDMTAFLFSPQQNLMLICKCIFRRRPLTISLQNINN